MDSSAVTSTMTLKNLDQMQQQLFKPSELNNILRKTLKTDGFMLKRHGIFALSDKTEGFLGQHFILELEYVENGQSDVPKKQRYFMKLLNGSFQIIFEITLSLNAYEKEKFFYEHLLGEYEEHGIDVSFAPKGYLCKPYVVVLEDLSLRKLRITSKMSFWDANHCKQALRTLAKLHSSSLIYENKMAQKCQASYSLVKEYPEMFQEMLFTNKSHSLIKSSIRFSIDSILKLIELVPELDNNRQTLFSNRIKHFYENLQDVFDTMEGYKQTILHGDVWSNNFMFRYENNVPVECVLIDYQLLKFGPPSMDVLQMLFSNTTKQFRDTQMGDLLEFYYKCLCALLPNFDMDKMLSKKEFIKACTEFKALIKLYCICDRCITLTPEQYINDNVTNNEDLRLFLFENRSQASVVCYQADKPFRDIITEDLIELCEILLNES